MQLVRMVRTTTIECSSLVLIPEATFRTVIAESPPRILHAALRVCAWLFRLVVAGWNNWLLLAYVDVSAFAADDVLALSWISTIAGNDIK